MRAILQHAYGSVKVLRLEEIDRPVPPDDRVLLRVRAASVNALDYHLTKGQPVLVRLMSGLLRPKDPRRGVDVAGTVEVVGKSVSLWKPGDEVFGTARGAFAEYVVAIPTNLVEKPPSVSFEQAAAVPIAAFTALEGLRDKAGLKAGQTVLVNGAGGGVGTFAVQLAKTFGARVTATTSSDKMSMVKPLGADEVIDYEKEDYVKRGQRYDVIFDLGASRRLKESRRALKPNGTYVMVGSPRVTLVWFLGRLLQFRLLSRRNGQRFVSFIARGEDRDLAVLKDLLSTGRIKPVIDRTYELADVPSAIEYAATTRASGKVVVTVGPSPPASHP